MFQIICQSLLFNKNTLNLNSFNSPASNTQIGLTYTSLWSHANISLSSRNKLWRYHTSLCRTPNLFLLYSQSPYRSDFQLFYDSNSNFEYSRNQFFAANIQIIF